MIDIYTHYFQREGSITSGDSLHTELMTEQEASPLLHPKPSDSLCTKEDYTNTTTMFLEQETEKRNCTCFYTREGKVIHTWSSLIQLIHDCHLENNEFLLRDCLQKGAPLIDVDNIFEAIVTLETTQRLEQSWLDRLVDILSDSMYLTKTDEWSDVIVSCPRTMSFLQHFLIQKMRREKVRVPTARRNGVKRKDTLETGSVVDV